MLFRSLDSSAATLGIVATGMTDGPDQEPTALKALQEARYVDGRDNSRLESVTAILADAGFDAAAALLVKVDRELLATCNARISAARSDMTRFGIQGVPALIAERDGRRTLMPSGVLFGDFEALNEFLTGA